MKLAFALYLAAGILIFNGCRKYERPGVMNQPGVAITFDDNYIDNWYKYLPLLDSFGAKATFYISHYHKLTQDQKNKLAIIQRKGHEIAFHTTSHPHMCQYLQAIGLNNLIQFEIYDDLNKMRRDGFYPKTFAYPFGEHNKMLDDKLLTIFKSVRALNGTSDLSQSLTHTSSNSILYALSMDGKDKVGKTIEKMMEMAAKNNNCLVLVGHMIENPSTNLQTPYKRLKFLLKKAKTLGLKFYTVSEISN